MCYAAVVFKWPFVAFWITYYSINVFFDNLYISYCDFIAQNVFAISYIYIYVCVCLCGWCTTMCCMLILCTLSEVTIKGCATILKVAMCFRSHFVCFDRNVSMQEWGIDLSFVCENPMFDINLMISCSANWCMVMDQYENALLIIQAYRRNPLLCVAYIAVRVIPVEMPDSTQKSK